LLHGVLRALPALARVPLTRIPCSVHSRLLASALNRVLARELRDGTLDFLADRCVTIEVRDLATCWRLTLREGRLAPAPEGAAALRLAGNAAEFALLATREEDPDTLFFQRRLHLDGDAELGLQVKNLLDALDLGDGRLPAAALPVIEAVRRAAARLREAGGGGA